MAIGAIIGTSLSYALQLLSAGYICNTERFDNKAEPFVGSIMRPFCLCNGKQDSMPRNMDCDQWTDVGEQSQEKIMGLRFGSHVR